ncbi:MAG: hypothetical protein ACK5BN_16365 [Planctomycetota bacterium]
MRLEHARKVVKASKSTKPHKPKKSKAQPAAAEVGPAILDAVQRVLGDIDVRIGEAKVRCRLRLGVSTAKDNEIRGRVFVSEFSDPGVCLAKIADLHRRCQVDEVVVVLPAEVGALWFKLLAVGEWHCCFPTGGGALVAYLGPRKRGFDMTFGGVGAVLGGCGCAE